MKNIEALIEDGDWLVSTDKLSRRPVAGAHRGTPPTGAAAATVPATS